MAKIVVVGSSNTDMVLKTSRFPMPGETLLGGEFFMFPGGKGANQAVAAARMGAQVALICKLGNDIFGKQAIEGFEREGIITKYIVKDSEVASGTALILVDGNGENEIVVASGANAKLSIDDILVAKEELNNADVILLQLEIPIESVLLTAKNSFLKGKKVILNPAPAQEIPAEIFSHLYLITPNETEAESLTGVQVTDEQSAQIAADVLIGRGVKNVIITLGASGAYFRNAAVSMMVAAPKVKAIDTTAAGDVFNGVLAVQIANNLDWNVAISTACLAASISVTRMGAQSSAPFLSEMVDTHIPA